MKNKELEKVVLVIRDGWGHRESMSDNAIHAAHTPHDDRFKEEYSFTLLEAAGEDVGLPSGYQGNSEVGHLTMGSGRIVKQNLKKINESIEDGGFFKKEEFLKAIYNCKKKETSLHLTGLLQKEGVHAHMKHLFALLDLCKREKFHDVFVHVITDGRDAPVRNAVVYLKELLEKMERVGVGEVATISGRYYAMDRDKRWERTKKAYDAIVEAQAENFEAPLETLEHCYKEGETDEFITPRKREGYEGLKEGDSFIFYNFRTDRPRQLSQKILQEGPEILFVAMTDYYPSMQAEVVFPEEYPKDILGETISARGLKQLRISETEKYAHVTFFFNGQRDEPFPGEERVMVPSPRVSTYDKEPEMSAEEVGERTRRAVRSGDYHFIVVNLVNCDMVGHTGDEEVVKKAVETVDEETGKITKEATKNGYSVLILADHGNAEDQREEWRTSHTTNPVPFIIASKEKYSLCSGGGLRDVAPTVLQLMGIEKPERMTGESLLGY